MRKGELVMAVIDERISTKKNGSTKYRVRVRRFGRFLTATFKTRQEAQQFVDSKEENIEEETHGRKNKHTMFDLLDRYEREILIHKKHTTARNQQHQILYWKKNIGHYSISEVTPSVIVDYRNKLMKGHSPSTVVRYLALLSHAFTIAIKEYEWTENNPVSRIMKPREPKGRTRYLSDEERARLLDACKASSNPYLYSAVVLSLSTGCRKSELLGLTWQDVDLDRAIMTFQDTKNREVRSVPLVSHGLDLMRDLKSGKISYPWSVKSPYVFPSHDGKMPVDIRHAWYVLKCCSKLS